MSPYDEQPPLCPDGTDTHPADGHHIVAHQHASHKLGLDALSQEDLLEIRQSRLVDEHRLVPWNLKQEEYGSSECAFRT